MSEDLLVYVGLKAAIIKDNRILLLTHAKGGIDLPGGKIQTFENLEKECEREVKEETGLDVTVGKPFAIWKHPYASKPILLVGFQCAWKNGEVTLSPEHTAYEWIHKDALANLPPEWSNPLSRLFF